MKAVIILGLIAGTLTTIAFIPQVIKTWKSKETKDISLWMYIILCIGIFSWLLYGLFTKDLPIILANSITLILAFIVLLSKLRYG